MFFYAAAVATASSPFFYAAAVATASSPYIEYSAHFCEGNFNNQSTYFKSTTLTLVECQSICESTHCCCFDYKSTVGELECRLTNGTATVQASAEQFDAYVDPSHPTPPNPPPPRHPSSDGGLSRYGCVGNYSVLSFCDTTKPPEVRAAELIAMLSPEEKGSLLTARTTVCSLDPPSLDPPGNHNARGWLLLLGFHWFEAGVCGFQCLSMYLLLSFAFLLVYGG
jgi:hypothetical protein